MHQESRPQGASPERVEDQGHWWLPQPPYWGAILTVAICFAIICFISAPRSLLDFAVCAICTVGYLFLFDFYKRFLYPAVLRVLHWSLFFPLGLLFACACALGVDFAGRHLGIALTLVRPVQFMTLAAAAGALGATITKLSRDNLRAAA